MLGAGLGVRVGVGVSLVIHPLTLGDLHTNYCKRILTFGKMTL